MDEDFGAAVEAGLALVSMSQGVVDGYATFHLGGAHIDLVTVAVAPSAQGAGVGRALIDAVEDRGRAAGKTSVRLYTNAAMTDNLTYYPRLGYHEVDRRTEAGFSRVYFEKSLPPAMATKGAVEGLYGRRLGQSGRRAPDDHPRKLDLSVPFDKAALFPAARVIRLEVGFGGGEHLIDHAKRAPDVGLMGAEPFETGLARAIADAQAHQLTNLRLFGGDARDIIDWLPNAVLDRVDVLYPDPWPKQRHWKRRFISAEGLDRLARVVVPGGTVRFASDIDSYVRWTRAHVAAHASFTLEDDSPTPWDDWPGTRYEAKALREGRPPRYLTLRRL